GAPWPGAGGLPRKLFPPPRIFWPRRYPRHNSEFAASNRDTHSPHRSPRRARQRPSTPYRVSFFGLAQRMPARSRRSGGTCFSLSPLLIAPFGNKRTADAAALEPLQRLVAEGYEDRWRAGVVRLFGSVRPTELDPVGQEQNRGSMLPDRLEPRRLGASVQKANSVAVPGKPSNPRADFVTVERRIEINKTEPLTV